MSLRVLHLRRDEIERTEQCARAGHEEWGQGPFSWEAQVECWRTWFDDPNTYALLLGLCDHREQARGILGALFQPDLRDGVTAAQVLFWYVLPEARGQGLALYRELVRACRRKGVQRIMPSFWISEATERLEQIYCRLGFKPAALTYMKEVA